MATTFPFQVNGLDKILALFDQLPKRLQRELYAELKVAAKEIRDGAKKDAPVDERRLTQSITDKEVSKTQFEVVAQSLHAGYQEFGTKSKTVIPAGLESIARGLKGPGAGSGSLYEAILGWVKRKGVAGRFSVKTRRRLGNKASKEAEDKTAAYLISKSIYKYGIKPRPYFYKQIPPVEKRLRQRVANMIQQALSV